MILKLKYFGIIAEALGKDNEELNINTPTVDELKKNYNEQLKNINYKIAVNHNLVEGNHKLKENDEVAFLPPFAGG